MQREKDYLKKKIDKVAILLAELLSKVTKTEFAFTKEEFASEFDKILTEEKTLSLPLLLEMEEKDFVKNLKERYEFNPNHLYLLGDLLYHYSQNFQEQKNNLNSKVVTLYENCITEGIAVSLDKYKLIERIKNDNL